MKKYDHYDLHFRFEVKKGIHFINAQYIHPLKQQLVQNYTACFADDFNIKAAVIFGSSVEFRCHSFSDLDICIERVIFVYLNLLISILNWQKKFIRYRGMMKHS